MSEDLRRRLIAARQAGAGSVEVSKRFRVSRRTVARLFGQYERTGELSPRQIGGYRRSRLQQHGKTLKRWIDKQADITLAELCERCGKELGVTIGINALWYQLRKLGLSFKKKRRAPPNKTDLTWRRRERFGAQWEPQHLVLIDETALNTKMARLHGRSAISRRCLGRVPYGTDKPRGSSPRCATTGSMRRF